MPITIRPYRRFPVQCAATYNAGLFLKLPLAYCLALWSLFDGATRTWHTALLLT